MIQIALYEPQIPPNTGNIARLCAALNLRLHLIGRLGFRLDERSLQRAGLDYWPFVDWIHHPTWSAFLTAINDAALWLVDNPAPRSCFSCTFQRNDIFLFGAETTGIPASIRATYQDRLISIPMLSDNVRSLNLASSVAIVAYEALRQINQW